MLCFISMNGIVVRILTVREEYQELLVELRWWKSLAGDNTDIES